MAKNQPFECMALAVAGWMRYVTGVDEAGNPIDVVDPQANRLRQIAREVGRDAPALVERYSAITEIFGELGQSRAFKATVSNWLSSLFALGVRGTLAVALN
jgi:fructuronate reductase